MIEYFDFLLIFPVYVIFVLYMLKVSSAKFTIVIIISFTCSSVVYAIFKSSFFAVSGLLISLLLVNILLKIKKNTFNQKSKAKRKYCLAMTGCGKTLFFYDGRKVIEPIVDETEKYKIGNVYIMDKIN